MKNNFSCVIIDDEPKAIHLLETHIKSLYNNINILATYSYWQDALPTLRDNGFDILFLDVSMPQKSGLELLNLIPNRSFEVIFVTANSTHAFEAFNMLAAGYVLKPVSDCMLNKAIGSAIDRIQHKYVKQQLNGNSNRFSGLQKLAIPNNKGLDYVNIDEILYLEAVTRYTKIMMRDKAILSSNNIGKFKNLLSEFSFCQVHRSFIVNLRCIKRYESDGILILSNGNEIPVAKSYRESFLSLSQKSLDASSSDNVYPAGL